MYSKGLLTLVIFILSDKISDLLATEQRWKRHISCCMQLVKFKKRIKFTKDIKKWNNYILMKCTWKIFTDCALNLTFYINCFRDVSKFSNWDRIYLLGNFLRASVSNCKRFREKYDKIFMVWFLKIFILNRNILYYLTGPYLPGLFCSAFFCSAFFCSAFFCPTLQLNLPNFRKILPGPLGNNVNLESWSVNK